MTIPSLMNRSTNDRSPTPTDPQDANNHALVAEVDSHAVGLLSTSSEIDISVLQAREIAPRFRSRARALRSMPSRFVHVM